MFSPRHQKVIQQYLNQYAEPGIDRITLQQQYQHVVDYMLILLLERDAINSRFSVLVEVLLNDFLVTRRKHTINAVSGE